MARAAEASTPRRCVARVLGSSVSANRGDHMTKRIWRPGIFIAVLWAGSLAGVGAGQRGGGAVQIDSDAIGGVVTSAKGPEAGVWVIAEARDLPTGFRKIGVP